MGPTESVTGFGVGPVRARRVGAWARKGHGMTAGAQAAPAGTLEEAGSNPALNPQAFARAMAETPVGERTGMTAAGAYAKAFALLVLLVLAAAFGWSQVTSVSVGGQTFALAPGWTWIVFLLAFIVGIVGAVSPKTAPVTGPLYALGQGALLGVVSHFYNAEWDGIVLQAVLATLAVFLATWLLYTTGVIKVTPGFARFVMIAMLALIVAWVAAWVLSLFGVRFTSLFSPTPLGIAIAALVVVLGALNLPLDFEFIRSASAAGAPKRLEWYAAFGLMLSIIWIYTSILRLLALLRSTK